jgi:hypothetical protein
MARSAPSSLKAKRGQLSEAQIAVNDFHTGCLAYLADPFSDTGALFRFDALAISQNLIDVFFLLVLLKFKRRVIAHCVAAAQREQEIGRRQG